VVISAGIGCGPARGAAVSTGAGVRGGGPTLPTLVVMVTTPVFTFGGLGNAKLAPDPKVKVEEEDGWGWGDEKEPLLDAIILPAAADATKLKVPPPTPLLPASKLGVLGGPESGCCCCGVLLPKWWSCSGQCSGQCCI